MAAAAIPLWLTRLLRAPARARPPHARRALASRPWDEVRRGLWTAVLSDPSASRPALAALRAVADAGDDAATGARLHLLEGQAIHRCGRVDEALAAYDGAARRLLAAGLADEATAAAIARVDALATVGRVDDALKEADRIARSLPRGVATKASVTLAINRGNALRLRGDVDGAARAYERAAIDADRLGNGYLGCVARVNAGVALVESGDARRARARFAGAADVFSAKGFADLAREARANAAWADLHDGRIGDAVRALDALAQEHREAGLSRREAVCRMDLSDALARAGDAGSAEREAVRAAAAFDAAGARAERAEALWMAASAAGAVAPARSRAHLANARRAAVASGRPALVVRCDVLLADLAAREGRPATPRTLTALARRADALGQRALAADAELLAASADLARERVASARRGFAALARRRDARPWTRIAAATGIARADAADPRRFGAAIARLRRVARGLDATRARLPGAWLRAQHVAEHLDPLVARVELLLARGRPADRAEAVGVLETSLARGTASPTSARARGPRLSRIRARLEAIYDRLARGEGPTRGGESDLSAAAALERRAHAWERAAAEEWRRRERLESPLFARAGSVRPSRVPQGTAVVHLWRNGTRLTGLVRIGAQVGPGVDLGPLEDLEGLTLSLRIRAHRWAFLRHSDPGATDPSAVERVLGELADSLLVPLDAASWPDDVRIASDPTLPDVPWEMLPLDGERLGESRRLLRVTAGASWPRPRHGGSGTVVIGVGEPELPGVSRELAAIAAAAGGARVVSGADATRAAVAHALSTARVVHIAGHGWDAEQAPPLGGVRVADGWFTAADLPPGGVSTDLVVLAACRSGRTAGRAALAWGGLVRALLSAGARRVLWTIDDVDDAATARLMTLFHEARATSDDDCGAFGRAAAQAAAEAGHGGAVLPFRLSGVAP